MPAAHARISPSAAPRWLRCPGSVKMADDIEEQRTSEYAAEGTVAHHVRECCLRFGFEPEDFIGDTIGADGFEFEVSEEMANYLRPGIEWVRERPGEVWIEYRVSLDRWLPGQFGTLDAGVVSPDLIIINDLKYGEGVPVEAEGNEQLMTYALGFWDNVARHKTAAEDFLIVIDQPRAGGHREWRVSLPELLAHGERLESAYREIEAENPVLRAGEVQCKWCPVKDTCPELARFCAEHFDMILDDLDDDELTLADADEFTPERRANVARHANMLKQWVDRVHARVLADAVAGDPTPGLKAVKGRRGRKEWINPNAAEKYLLKRAGLPRKDIFSTPELLSPTQVERLLPKAKRQDLERFWTQAEGKPVLVPEDDPKPAINRTDMLDDLDSEDAQDDMLA